MKKMLSKFFMTAVAVLVMAGMFPADFTVSNQLSPFTITAQAASKKIHLKKTKFTLTVGKSYTQKLINKNGKAITGTKVKWKSANKKIATVSKSGKVTGKKAGKVKITATYKNKKYTFTVTVKKASTKATKGDPDNDDSKTNIVYRTPTGKRYHLDPDCGGKNSYTVKLAKAKNAGLTPCQKCAK